MARLSSFFLPLILLLGVVLALPVALPDTDSLPSGDIHGLAENNPGMTLNRSSSPLTPLLPSEPTNNQKTVVVKKIVYVRPGDHHQQKPAPAPAPPNDSSQSTQSSTSNGGWQQQMLELVNNERRKFGKPALRLNAGLNSAAQAHSNYQSSIHKMTHDNPKGGLFDRMKPFVTGARGAAENVAFNQRSVDEVMKAWITSPGHHDNIVGDYNSVGFGQSNLYWTQEFAAL